MLKKALPLIIAFGFPLGIGYGASKISANSFQIYSELTLPPLAPPGFVFGLVWTVLYLLMGWASYLVWQADSVTSFKKKALLLYAVQLGVNFFWTLFFFNLSWKLFAFWWLLLLLALLWSCMIRFKKISRPAFWLLWPYLLWGIFAAYLNLSIYFLN